MKLVHLFKKALILATVSSLTLSSAMAMDKENTTHSTTVKKLDEWNETVEKKDLRKLQELAEQGLRNAYKSASQSNKTNTLGELIWENRTDRLSKALFSNINEGVKIDYSQLEDAFEQPALLWNNNLPTVTNSQILKEEVKTVSPQKTSKELWEADVNNPTKRFDFVIGIAKTLNEKGDLPSVAVKKQKGEWKINAKDVNASLDLNKINQKLSKNQFYDKDANGFKIAISEMDRIFNKQRKLDPTQLPDPSGGVWSDQYGLQRKFDFNSKLYPYYVTLGYLGQSEYVDVSIFNQIINKIKTGELEYK